VISLDELYGVFADQVCPNCGAKVTHLKEVSEDFITSARTLIFECKKCSSVFTLTSNGENTSDF